MAKVEITTGQGQATEHELLEYNTIGRHPDNNLQLLDRIVSKEHAVIYVRDGQYYFRDLGSLNGSFKDNQRISEVALNHRDIIILGSTRIMFLDDEDQVAVNIKSSSTESHIRAKMDMPSAGKFLPEDQLQDDWTLRSDYERLRIAHEIQHSIGGEMNVDVLMDKILESAFNFLKADRGAILLFGEDGQLRPRVTKSLDGSINEREIGLSSTIINAVISDRTGVLSSDAMMDSRFKSSKSIMMQGIRSSMAVPIMCRKDLQGMMYLDSKIATGAFSEKDLNIFSAIAQQAGALLDNIRQARKLEQEALTREKFSRLLSPNLVEELVSGNLEVTKGGMYRPVTILFADIRGFTSLTERSEASEIVEMLNEYFERMVEIIFANEGTLDKFIGDEIMVLWGSPVTQDDHALRAVRTAWEMQRELDAYNLEREQVGQKPIKVGIGVCSGECVVGYMGSTRKMEYTSIGDPVNTASRLCDLAKPMEIVIASPTYKLVANYIQAEEMPPTPVKGKAEPLQIYRVVGLL